MSAPTTPIGMNDSKTEFNIIISAKQTEIIEGAVRAVLDLFSEVEATRLANAEVEGGQL